MPTKLVANLLYNIATPLVVESLEHAASPALVRDGSEVADRFFARPRTKAYGAVSVLGSAHERRASLGSAWSFVRVRVSTPHSSRSNAWLQ